ncbi:MAG: MGMT family protein [Candidatus Paceibacterota bacterium]
MTPFQEAVFSATKSIPKGSTLTYKELAHKIGKPKAYRAVANALGKNKSKEVPCHRVIRSDGNVGGYSLAGGSTQKKRLLIQEKAI